MHSLAQSRRLFLLGLSLTLLGDASLGYAFSSQSASPQAENAQDIAAQRALVHAVEAKRDAIDKENSTSPSGSAHKGLSDFIRWPGPGACIAGHSPFRLASRRMMALLGLNDELGTKVFDFNTIQ